MRRYIVPFTLFIGTLYFGYLFIQGPSSSSLDFSAASGQGTVRYNRLQQYQQETAVKMDIERQKLQFDKRASGPEMNPGHKKKNRFHKTELRKDKDPRSIDLEESSDYQAMTLDQRMDEFLAKKQYYEELEKSQKLAYVEQFVKEAYKMGFVVVVNDQMEIESVDKIGK